MLSLHFDTALPMLMRIVSEHETFAQVEEVCVIRDLKGCLRLIVRAKQEAEKDGLRLESLENELQRQLQSWFQKPILTTFDRSVARKRTAEILLEQATAWPPHWPQEVKTELGEERPIEPKRWRCLQRVQSKETWLSRISGEPPWPLAQGSPAIVSFYSFKGGVGRTTCMGIMAYRLARAGKKVVCVDLDLESPGVSDIFGLRMPEVGLIDYLLSSLLGEGKATLAPADLCQKVRLHGTEITVIAAGKVNVAYVEKLARLDYVSGTDLSAEIQSPVAVGMRNLLRAIQGQEKPDFLFLDCRAGFHDLGGLGLHDLAHVEVIVGRASLQTQRGLEVILALQKQRRQEQQRRICLVQSFVSADPQERVGQHERWRSTLYDIFQKYQMYKASEIPEEDDDQASHFPWTLEVHPILGYARSLAEEELRSLLENEAGNYAKLCRRVVELCEAEPSRELEP